MKEIVKDPKKEQAMIDASMKLFGAKDFLGTKMEEIAKEAGVSKGLLFHYFGSKINLYLATYDYTRNFFYRNAELEVWTTASDFIEMVARSTRHKLGLQIQYPTEFNFLFGCLREHKQLPDEVVKALDEKLQGEYQFTMELVEPVLDRMEIKEPYTKQDVLRVLYYVVQGETEAIQAIMSQHPEWTTMDQLEPLIEQMKNSLSMVQTGFLKKK
ncbi:TetR/AcrR family transcriptional regulator [Enterococcus sp. 669A]|uniref:TetR/AcrR family transcriptional regulator n=1 Tax=Candidatus Enterococcus moelleringii TaxID=2815325 RepID=A0ABS3LDL6_9ENTE|nr:TetR/AcrR family transcriptional regulator [Enterococcus sp. 669A]